MEGHAGPSGELAPGTLEQISPQSMTFSYELNPSCDILRDCQGQRPALTWRGLKS